MWWSQKQSFKSSRNIVSSPMIQVNDHHSRVEVLISGQVQAREVIARCFSETECGERKLDVLLYSEINAGGYRLVGEINLEQVGNRPVHNRIRVEIYYALHIWQKLGKHKPHIRREQESSRSVQQRQVC
jgi:hypothetical protein